VTKNPNQIEIETIDSLLEAAQNFAVSKPKKKYSKPILTEPVGVIETTKFFFQGGLGGSLAREKPHSDPR
jgi:hypothetical protein